MKKVTSNFRKMTRIYTHSLAPPERGFWMSRQSQLSPDNILRFLQLRNGPASLEDLSRSLQVRRSSRRALLQMLAKLKKRGLIEELSHGRFLLRQTSRTQQPSGKPRPAQEPPAEKFPQHKT